MKGYSLERILNGTKRRLARVFKYHPTSAPYISGDTFRALAQHIFDADSTITPTRVRSGDIVFVQSFRIKEFFTRLHPNIKNPYVLITHNGDENITADYLHYIDENIVHWFAQNCLTEHPKLTPLPIGLENKWYYLHGIPKYFDVLRSKKSEKKNRILYKFNVATNPTERTIALAALEKSPLADTHTDWRESWSYLQTLQNYAFVASPVGNGADCIRAWEAMYLGTIPIVTASPMTTYFSSLGLPLVVLADWSKLQDMTPELLQKTYATIAQKPIPAALWADFWVTLIINSKVHGK